MPQAGKFRILAALYTRSRELYEILLLEFSAQPFLDLGQAVSTSWTRTINPGLKNVLYNTYAYHQYLYRNNLSEHQFYFLLFLLIHFLSRWLSFSFLTY